jgi:4,5-dihydroxyphthalate decarboxylase
MANDFGRTITKDAAERSKTLYPIDLAVADYDRTRPIIDGRVKAEGIALNTETAWIGDFCTRPVYEQYDAAEMSLSWYVAARCRGEPVVALPVFPLRMPVLAYVLVRADAPYEAPRDLRGKRIGAPLYRLTVNLWLRGIFREHYGLAPEDVTWVTCETEGAAGFVIPPEIKVEAAKGGTPDALLERGEVDAILVPQLPQSFLAGTSKLRRLFRDAQAEMRGFVRRTGIFPITHTVVMKEELARREPWIAENLYRAFAEAQRQCDRFLFADSKHLSLPDAVFLLEEQRAAYGDDPWVQGLGPNRHVIATFLRYAHEQGYIPRVMAVDELFAANTLAL